MNRKPPDLTPELSMSLLSKNEQRVVESVRSTYGNPEKTLERKIIALARLLDCTEEEATHLFLHQL